jgi:hypothetical protein
VKSVLHLQAGELGLVQKGAGVALTTGLLVLGMPPGQPLDLPYVIMALAPLLGIPLGEQAKKLFDPAGE